MAAQPFRLLLIAVAIACAMTSAISAENDLEYRSIVDETTGIKISLPLYLTGNENKTRFGKHWASTDKSMSVDTFAYSSAQDFRRIYENLKAISGRVLSRDEWTDTAFLLAGHDRDGSNFQVEARRSGDSVRGYSVVLDRRQKERGQALVNRLSKNFDPYPAASVQQNVEPAVLPDKCESQIRELQTFADKIALDFESKASAKPGEPIRVEWRRGPALTGSTKSVHVVLAMPERARFIGDYIVPIPPGGRAPSNISFGAGNLRVFIPISDGSIPERGDFSIKAYQSGSFTISSAIVAKTECGETLLSKTNTTTIQVDLGPAHLLVQDLYSIDQPDRLVISANGRYRLDIFKASYRVYEVASGVKIVDRAGRHPNFSPTARYVAAYKYGTESTGGTLEVVDLLTGEPIPNLTLQGPTIGWSLGDALLVEGNVGHPEIRMRRSLVDPTFDVSPDDPDSKEERGMIAQLVSGRADSAWGRYRLKVFLDQGIVLLEDHPTAGEPYRTWLYKLASGKLLADGAEEVRKALKTYGIDGFAIPPGWDLSELRLSHYSPSVEQLGNRAIKQKPFLVSHQEKPVASKSTIASTGEVVVRALDWRAQAASPDRVSGYSIDSNRFMLQLAQYGICVRPGCLRTSKQQIPTTFVTRSTFLEWTFQYATQSTTFTKPPVQIEQDLIKDVPIARNLLNGAPNQICYQANEDALKFRLVPDKKGHTDVHGVWSWSTGPRKFWLVQAVCSHAGIMNAPVILFVGDGASHINLLGGSAQDPDGVNKDFQGEPNEAILRIKPWILDDRWLLIAAPAGNSAAIVDLDDPSKPVFIYNVADAFATAALFRTSDGRHLVQLNTDGRFYVYAIIAGGRRIISGRWIDDEMVFVTAKGYYAGSHEGGQFVHLKFEGREEVYALDQFERVLKRRDIIDDVLAGRIEDGPYPTLDIPPNVTMDTAREGAGFIAQVRATSPTDLKTLRLFDDGELVKELPLEGRQSSSRITFENGLKGRWLTVVAEDTKGFFSTPLSIQSPAAASTDRVLHAVLVGIDAYNQPEMKLNFASSDAGRLAGALQSQRGKYFAQVQVTQLLDRNAGANAILTALESAVSSAKPGDIVFFSFAGHGIQGAAGLFYLAPSGFDANDSDNTGLAWSRVAGILSKSKARVVVVLDACHSGSADIEKIGSNDQAVSDLLGGHRAPILVFAASKGRQFSLEDPPGKPPRWGGGVFTFALVRSLTDDRALTDSNANGALEISELYRAVKSRVVSETNGEQTPWLVRQDLIGDFALF